MSLESIAVQPNESKGIHVDVDSRLDYSVIELKDLININEADLEKSFETKELDPETLDTAISHYESMLNAHDSFLGSGYSGLVSKQHPKLADSKDSKYCVKCRWDTLMVNNRSKNVQNLPENLIALKEVENHFTKANEEKKRLRKRGVEFLPDNSVLREAVVQYTANKILTEAGMPDVVPGINYIIKIERGESGDVNGDPFAITEEVNLMLMDQIPGYNLQEIILHNSSELARSLDVDAIEARLRLVFNILHENGIVHRDLTLRNIMLDSTTLMPHVIDFGKGVYDRSLSGEDKNRDIEFIDRAVAFLAKFKADPQKAGEDLKELQAV